MILTIIAVAVIAFVLGVVLGFRVSILLFTEGS